MSGLTHLEQRVEGLDRCEGAEHIRAHDVLQCADLPAHGTAALSIGTGRCMDTVDALCQHSRTPTEVTTGRQDQADAALQGLEDQSL